MYKYLLFEAHSVRDSFFAPKFNSMVCCYITFTCMQALTYDIFTSGLMQLLCLF